MALRLGRGGRIGIGVFAALVLVLGWAWYDGGEVPLSELTEPALLPKVG